MATAARILASFDAPFRFGLDEVGIRPTIGIAVSEGDVRDADEMLRNADLAMYTAKSRGKGRYEIFEP